MPASESPRYQLDRLLVPQTDPRTGKVKPGFETVAQCVAEDQVRARSLRETAARIRANSSGIRPLSPDGIALRKLNIDPGAALNLADRLEAGAETLIPPPTLASMLFMREHRLRLGARLLELIDNHPELETKTFTAVHSTWGFSASDLIGVNARQIKNQFRTQLNRTGVTEARGVLFAWLHGEFEPVSQEFQLHFHGLCAGEKARALDQLRGRQGFVRTETIYRPIVMKPLQDRAQQVSYLIQSFWPEKMRLITDDGFANRRTRTKRRIREPSQSLYLLWLDKWKLSDLHLLNGLRFEAEKLSFHLNWPTAHDAR